MNTRQIDQITEDLENLREYVGMALATNNLNANFKELHKKLHDAIEEIQGSLLAS